MEPSTDLTNSLSVDELELALLTLKVEGYRREADLYDLNLFCLKRGPEGKVIYTEAKQAYLRWKVEAGEQEIAYTRALLRARAEEAERF